MFGEGLFEMVCDFVEKGFGGEEDVGVDGPVAAQ